jgi:hypothetical protein
MKISICVSFIGLLLSITFLSMCSPPTEVDEGGPDIIVPGISVEGIKLGDSKETVEAKLGKPTSVGWADGQYRGWRLYSYEQGTRLNPIVNLQFYFIDEEGDYGPIDLIGIGSAYKGKTKMGISIGTPITKVHEFYGLPDTCLFDQLIVDFYCINNKMLQIHYNDSLISGMSMGYFIPIPQDPLYPCK